MRELSELSPAEFDNLLAQYPWFAYARRLFVCKMAEMGPEQRSEALRDAVIFFPEPQRLLAEIPVHDVSEEDALSRTSEQPQKVLVIGGDYFSKDDFESLGEEGKNVVASFEKELARASQSDGIPPAMTDKDFETKYFTETLARVYAQQGFYDKAIEVYEKLILLNPEKSIYFASHIDGLKKNL